MGNEILKTKVEKIYESLKEKVPDSVGLKDLYDQWLDTGDDSESAHILLRRFKQLNQLNWGKKQPPKPSFRSIKKILDRTHYGVDEVKDLIIEYVSVLKLQKDKKRTPILLLVSAAGCGKTTLAESIAKALRRPFQRVSMGGRNRPEYLLGMLPYFVGSKQGMILDCLTKSGCDFPVVLLDEIDKIDKNSSSRSGLEDSILEILDYEQNKEFTDSWLEIPYDISNVLFIATANNIENVSPILLSRMEVVEIPSYSENDKVKIAQNYIIPRVIEECGLKSNHLCMSRDAIQTVIRGHTNEGGVRTLSQRINKIGRKLAREVVEKTRVNKRSILSPKDITKYLGPYSNDPLPKLNPPGTVNGLAYTEHGGELLRVQVSTFKGGKNKVIVTGLPGEMTKESVEIVTSWVNSSSDSLRVEPIDSTIHIHYPECTGSGVDGPSAGVTMATALISRVRNIAVDTTIAMTGEIDLNGGVYPIGGLREKILAAKRSNKRKIIYPKGNQEDLDSLPPDVKGGIEFFPVENMYEVLKICNLL